MLRQTLPVLAAISSLAILAAPAASGAAQDIQLERALSGHLVTPVEINGQGPYPFIVDTGASHTAIAQGLAVYLGYVPRTSDRDVQSLTTLFQSERFTLDHVSALGIEAEALRSVIIETPPEAELSAVGIIGSDLLSGRSLVLNLRSSVLSLDRAPPDEIDGRIPASWGVLFAKARVGGLPADVRVLVDTGSVRSFVNSRFAARMTTHTMRLRTRVGGVSGRLHSEEADEAVTIERLRIGGYCRQRTPVMIADLDIFQALGWSNAPAMVVGLDLLSDAVLHIDHDSATFSIDPAPGATNYGCSRERADAQLAAPDPRADSPS